MSKLTGPKPAVRWEDFNSHPADNSSITILTVDDNEALRYSLARSLREAGYKVTEAANGEDAIALASKNPDLITLDINLPDMSGFDVCRRLKTDTRTSHIPILHISSTFVDPGIQSPRLGRRC